MDTLFSNVTIVTMNEKMDVLFGSYLGVKDGKISYIAKVPPKEQPQEIIDGTGMVLMPGLVNCHTHLGATALRCLTDDLSYPEALEQQLMKEDKMDSRAALAAVKLGIAECLRFGITSVSDLYYYPEATAQAAAEAGIKANIALSSYRYTDEGDPFDFEEDPQCQLLRRVVEKWNDHDDGRIRIDCGILSQYTSNHPLWEALGRYAHQENLGLQLHLAQEQLEQDDCMDRTGLGVGELLCCHDLFLNGGVAAGCNALTEPEMAMLAKKKVSAAVCPTADGKLGRKPAPVLQLVKSGMNVCLGTGGVVESTTMDLFEAMRMLCADTRRESENAAALPATAALMMATVCGARAQGRSENTGMIKEGFDADLVLVDFSAPHLMPCHNVLSSLVFAAKGGDVALTMVRGKTLYANGKFPTIDLGKAVEELTQYAMPRLFENEVK